MRQSTRVCAYTAGAMVLFAAVFVVTSYIALYILYAFIYGDVLGGRWQHFAWPIAAFAAFSAALVLITQGVVPERFREHVYKVCFAVAFTLFVAANVIVWDYVY